MLPHPRYFSLTASLVHTTLYKILLYLYINIGYNCISTEDGWLSGPMRAGFKLLLSEFIYAEVLAML